MIKWFRISLDELIKGSVNQIYKRIIVDKNKQSMNFRSHCIFFKCLPSYLQSFNYKLHFNLLPVKTMFQEYALDTDSRCYFCDVGPESIFHLFGTCERLKVIWNFLSRVSILLSDQIFDFQRYRVNLKLDLTGIKCSKLYEKTYIYLNSVTNYAIWKCRNNIRYNNEKFCEKQLLKSILRSVGGRKNIYNLSTHFHQIPYINELYERFIVVFHNYPFDNG